MQQRISCRQDGQKQERPDRRLQMGGELRRDGGVIGGEADVRAHPGAEAVDMVAVHGVTTFKWESRIGYSNQRAG